MAAAVSAAGGCVAAAGIGSVQVPATAAVTGPAEPAADFRNEVRFPAYHDGMQVIARVEDIPETGLKFSYDAGPFEDEGILLRLADGTVKAYKNECRHLPMRLDGREPSTLWDDGGRHLVCNSHGALYRPEDGLCISGPCRGSHLREVPLVVRDGEVAVDTNSAGSFFDV